jgi:hypothetical protein
LEPHDTQPVSLGVSTTGPLTISPAQPLPLVVAAAVVALVAAAPPELAAAAVAVVELAAAGVVAAATLEAPPTLLAAAVAPPTLPFWLTVLLLLNEVPTAVEPPPELALAPPDELALLVPDVPCPVSPSVAVAQAQEAAPKVVAMVSARYGRSVISLTETLAIEAHSGRTHRAPLASFGESPPKHFEPWINSLWLANYKHPSMHEQLVRSPDHC